MKQDRNVDLSMKIEEGFGPNGLGILSVTDVWNVFLRIWLFNLYNAIKCLVFLFLFLTFVFIHYDENTILALQSREFMLFVYLFTSIEVHQFPGLFKDAIEWNRIPWKKKRILLL